MSYEITVHQNQGRHLPPREVKVLVENALSKGEAYRRIANRLVKSCKVTKVEEVR